MAMTKQGGGTRLEPLSAPLRTGGIVKFLSDVAVVAEIKLRMSARVWHWQLFAVLSMPLPIFFLTSTFVPDDPAALRRIIAGTLLFGIAFSIGLLVGNQFAYERFSRVQKLYVMMPVAKTAYVVGSLAHLSLMGAASVIVLSAFAMTRGIDVRIAWTIVPMLVLAVLVMVGLVLFIVSFAPSLDTANMSASTLGLVLAVMSPVYYTMEQAPLLIRWFGYVSPLRYAADGISASLSGSTDVLFEMAVLAGCALVAMALGLWKLPWRES